MGVTALNLIAPGLGLLRVGDMRAGVFFLFAPFALLPMITYAMGHLPITGYGRAISALVVVLGLLALLYAVPMMRTWRQSKFRLPVHRWSHWYALTPIAVFVLLLSRLATPLMHHFYKPFYAPSESMAPTIGKGDKFIADMRWRGPVKRGEIIIFYGPDSVRVSRVAAVAGDRIAMRDGVPIVNGTAALVDLEPKQAVFTGYDGTHSAAMMAERLPGEASGHHVIDTGPSEFDNMQEVVVPADHFFAMGDNRDHSADSRVPVNLAGVGMVPLTAIIGRPMYIHWSSNRSKIGTRLD